MGLLLDCMFFFFRWNKICGEGEDYSNFIFGFIDFWFSSMIFLKQSNIYGEVAEVTECNLWESTLAEKVCLYFYK